MLSKLLQFTNAKSTIVVSSVTAPRSRQTFAIGFSFKASPMDRKSSFFHSPVTTRMWGPGSESPAITADTVETLISCPHLAYREKPFVTGVAKS